jgi:K+-transporting ATPase KdpF subunit
MHGLPVSRFADRLVRGLGGFGLWLRTAAEAVMSWIYVVSGVLALGVLIYLVVALLFPEKF